ncbi:hypothetical protein [Nonomuraea sp. NPDC023979]|uniref:hypothetical protein n=1 Tax=Nonomuraea sp. NPDC023979 TaxID=3154796 RepID=UPI0033FC37FF
MTRFEAARALGVAPSEVRDVEETGDGARVRMTNGAVRLITGDGVFACDEHPASAHLRRWEESEPESVEDADEPRLGEGEGEGQDDGEGEGEQQGEPEGKGEGQGQPEGEGEHQGDEVPDGTVEQVLAWVGDDQARAVRALDAEHAREKPRSTLVARLTELREG